MDRVDLSLIALRRILRATELYNRDLSQAVGMTAAQFRALQIVAQRGQCTATDIATQMRVTQATITALVDKLVARGMVMREKSTTDRRQTNISPSEAGLAAIASAPDALQQRFVRKMAAMEDWEQAMLVAALERVALMLDADDLDASPVLAAGDIKTEPGPIG